MHFSNIAVIKLTGQMKENLVNKIQQTNVCLFLYIYSIYI